MSNSLIDGSYLSGAGSNRTGDHWLANPFNDAASTQMPTTMKGALRWAEYVWTVMGTYSAAMKRIVSYFLTEIEIGGDVGDEEKEKYEEFLRNKLHVMQFLANVMEGRICYGNAFISVLVPFKRLLQCPKTGDIYSLSHVYENFDFKFSSDFKFIATCPKTGWRGSWNVIDKDREEEEHIILKQWNVHEIEIISDEYTGESVYFWRIPEQYKNAIRDGRLHHLERVNLKVLEAIKQNKLFKFKPSAILHLKEITLPGIKAAGWGLPRSLINFRQLWYLQMLRRSVEAIAMDYIIPFRLLTPTTQNNGAGGPLETYNAGDYAAQLRAMVRKRRRDPAAWQMLPFPVNYQMLGADAKQIIPTDLVAQGFETLLNETGTPVEFYNGSMTTQAAPVALRLFESTHRQLVTDSNIALQWICDRISKLMSWEAINCKLTRVTLADDMQKQVAALQLMGAGQVSGKAGLSSIGLDWKTEQRRIAEESRIQQEIQTRLQEEMEQAGYAAEISKGVDPNAQPAEGQQAGGQPAGGDPAAGGMGISQQPVTDYLQSMSPNTAVTPADIEAQAGQLAQQLLGLPEGIKDSELRKLKQSNPTLHAMTKEQMGAIRNSARMQGGAMLMQQQQQGG